MVKPSVDDEIVHRDEHGEHRGMVRQLLDRQFVYKREDGVDRFAFYSDDWSITNSAREV